MNDLKKLGEIFYNGEMINLSRTDIRSLQDYIEQINMEERKIKSELYKIIENF